MILSYYFIRHFLKWLLGIVSCVSCFVFLFDLTEFQRRVGARFDIPFFAKLQIVFFKIPFLLEELMPFLIFFAALGLFWQLNRTRELIILRTSGLSVWRFFLPIVGVTFCVGVLDLVLLQPMSTRMMREHRALLSSFVEQTEGENKAQLLPSGVWLKKKHDQNHLIYHVRPGPRGEALALFILNPQHQLVVHYDAEGFSPSDPLVLRNVWIRKPAQVPVFEAQIELPFTLSFEDITNSQPDPEMISFWSLPGLINLIQRAGMSTHRYDLQWQSLCARTFWLWAMTCLGGIFALRSPRHRGSRFFLGLGAVTCFFFYFVRDFTRALGNAGELPLWLAAWGPFFLTTFVALTLLFYIEESA